MGVALEWPALILAKSALCVFYLWSWLAFPLLWSEAGHQVCWQLLIVLSLESLVRRYTVICSWLTVVLSLGVVGRGYAVNQGHLPVVLRLGPFGMHHDMSCGQLPLVLGLWQLS